MKRKQFVLLFLGCTLLSCLFMLPYFSEGLSVEHDTLFHLSRIEGLAQSFQSGKLFPDVYFHKNDGFGYASALFYCDLFLVPAALLYNCGLGVALCYKITIFLATWISAWSMGYLMLRMKRSMACAYIASALYLFCNYRITDVYVRGATGEVIAMAFIPFILLGAYELFAQKKPTIKYLIIGFTAVALSHNLTLLLCVAGFGFMLLFNLKTMNVKKWILLLTATLTSICLSAWFLFPMLEQTSFQEYYLHFYASSSDLKAHTMLTWQYLINEIIFGVSGHHVNIENTMVVTPGIALLFLPVLMLFDIHPQQDETHRFVQQCCFLGYFFAIFCSDLVPWESLSMLRIIQFPWRLMTLACPMLAVVCAYALDRLKKDGYTMIIILLVVLINAMNLLKPAETRTPTLYNNTTYSELMDGSIIDPYFANTSYNRIEVAGADYLPIGFIDYKNASNCITDLSDNEIACGTAISHNTTFNAPQATEIILPVTAYKGYHVYSQNEEIQWTTVKGRISFNTKENSEFTLVYQKTPLHLCSIALSIITFITMMAIQIIKKFHKSCA